MLGSGIFDLNGFNQTVANISGGSGTILSSGTNAAGDTLTVGNSTPANATYGGLITSNLNLAKVGTSTLTLTGANTYTGTTSVTGGGTLALASTASLANTAITVSGSGSTLNVLAGTGTVNIGSTTAASAGATLSLVSRRGLQHDRR